MVKEKADNENFVRAPLGHLDRDMEMEKIFEDEETLTNVVDQYLYDTDEEGLEDAPSAGWRKLVYFALVLAVIGGFSALAYYAYQFGNVPKDTSELQLIKADPTPYKEKPDEPGGMEVPNMDKTVYDSIASDSKEVAKVERLLPPPEEPVAQAELAPVTPTPAESAAILRPDTMKPSHEALTSTQRNDAAEAAGPIAVNNESVVGPVAEAPPPAVTPPAPVAVELEETLKPISEKDLQTVPEKAVPDTVTPPSASTVAKYRVQLGAYKSELAAAQAWKRLSKSFDGDLKGLDYFVERKDLGEKGIFYRLQAGPFENGASARLLCKKLVANNQGCFFVEVQ